MSTIEDWSSIEDMATIDFRHLFHKSTCNEEPCVHARKYTQTDAHSNTH